MDQTTAASKVFTAFETDPENTERTEKEIKALLERYKLPEVKDFHVLTFPVPQEMGGSSRADFGDFQTIEKLISGKRTVVEIKNDCNDCVYIACAMGQALHHSTEKFQKLRDSLKKRWTRKGNKSPKPIAEVENLKAKHRVLL